MDIPVLIISFNNHRYVENTIKQLENLSPTKMSNIIIMDNNSSDINTINFINILGLWFVEDILMFIDNFSLTSNFF